MKALIMILLLACAINGLKAQPRFLFIGGETHDFGNVPDGPDISYTYRFKNAGNQPLIISNVATTSGDDVAEWDKKPVAPGKMGGVKVTFHTPGHPGGYVHRSIYITSNVPIGKPQYELEFNVRVMDKNQTTPEVARDGMRYPKDGTDPPRLHDAASKPVVKDKKDGARFQFLNGEVYDFGNVPEGPELSCSFKFRNVGNRPLIIREVFNTSGGDPDISFPKEPILPGKGGELKVTFRTETRGGQPFQKPIVIRSNAISRQPQFEVLIKGYIQPTPKDTINVPRFYFKGGRTHDFGIIPEGPEADYVFEFKNTGRQPLIVYDAHTGDGATTCEWPRDPVMPGKTGSIRIHFITNGKSGQVFQKDIYISSNAISDQDRYIIHFQGAIAAKK